MDGRRRVRWPVLDDGMWTVRVVHLQFPMKLLMVIKVESSLQCLKLSTKITVSSLKNDHDDSYM